MADDDRDERLRETVDGLMACLDDDDRALLQMKLDGFNNDDLAMLTGLSYAAVATRLHRIRRRMAEYARKLHYIE